MNLIMLIKHDQIGMFQLLFILIANSYAIGNNDINHEFECVETSKCIDYFEASGYYYYLREVIEFPFDDLDKSYQYLLSYHESDDDLQRYCTSLVFFGLETLTTEDEDSLLLLHLSLIRKYYQEILK